MMARGELILRQWNLLKMLQTRGEGIPLRDLADQLAVSERTIQRDFEVLQELRFPIEFDDDEFGKRFWRMSHDFFRTGPLMVSLTEAVSLHLAEEAFERFGGNRPLHTRTAKPREKLVPVVRLTSPVVLDDQGSHLLHPFVRGVTTLAVLAFAPSSCRLPRLREARVDHAVVQRSAIGAAHILRNASAQPRASRTKLSRWAVCGNMSKAITRSMR